MKKTKSQMNNELNSSVYKKVARHRLDQEEGKCDRCPPHDVENRSKRPRSDKYKSQRKGLTALKTSPKRGASRIALNG